MHKRCTFNSLRPSDAYMCQLTNHHWFRQWLVVWLAPGHYYLNWCWNIVNWTLGNKNQWNLNRNSYIFSCDQAALQMVFSVCLSVRPSVCPSVCLSVTPFWLCSHHRIIMKFSGVITNDQSKVHAKGQGLRSKVKVTEVTTQLNRFRTVTPVCIDIWW